MPNIATPVSLAGAAYTLAVATCDELPLRTLTPRERRDHDRLPHHARRREWLAGRSAAKRAIGARWNLPADRIELQSVPGAAPRPFVRDRSGSWSPLPDRVTIAHRDDVGIAAVFESSASVGVDLERAGEISLSERRYFLSHRERDTSIDTTLVWTLKEAAWKALGLSLRTPFTALRLVFRADTNELSAVRHGRRERRACAHLVRIGLARPLIAAVVEIATEAS